MNAYPDFDDDLAPARTTLKKRGGRPPKKPGEVWNTGVRKKKAAAEKKPAKKKAPNEPMIYLETFPSVHCKKFIAKDAFVIGESHDGEVLIHDIETPFRRFFMNGDGLIETDLRIGGIQSFEMTGKSLADTQIVRRFQLESTLFILPLFDLYTLLVKQGRGQPGKLAVANGSKNVFYILDMQGNARAADMYWRTNKGWILRARSMLDPGLRHEGDRVFRKSPKLCS